MKIDAVKLDDAAHAAAEAAGAKCGCHKWQTPETWAIWAWQAVIMAMMTGSAKWHEEASYWLSVVAEGKGLKYVG